MKHGILRYACPGIWIAWLLLAILGCAEPAGQSAATPSPPIDLTRFPPLPTPAAPPMGRIAFISDHEGQSDIYVLRLAGREVVRLTHTPADEFELDWSPDGWQIAFNARSQLYVMQSDGSQLREIADNPTGLGTSPTWSPDGTRIAFTSDRTLYAIRPDGSDQSTLGGVSIDANGLSWSPDGHYIAYTLSEEDNTRNIWFVALDDAAPFSCIFPGRNVGDLAWSPDGKRIAFTSDMNSNEDSNYASDIYIMNSDGTGLVRVTTAGAIDPTWSPDGTRLAFVSNPNQKGDLFIVNADGTQLTQVTDYAARISSPVWR